VLVEASAQVAESLKAQIARLNTRAALVLNVAAEDFLQHPGEPFDIVFLDPPFRSAAPGGYLKSLDQGGWLKPDAFVYLESPRSSGPPPLPAGIELTKSKSAGEVGYHLARVNRRKGHA
jgi:16S rRNA (guanine966-N2)-methyltransferase